MDAREGSGEPRPSRGTLASRLRALGPRAWLLAPRRLPERVGPLGLTGRIAGTLVTCLVAAVTPPGILVRAHLFNQAKEVADVLRLKPDDEELRRALLGTDYSFMSFVRGYTEPDDIILMSDQFADSELDPLKGKSQRWATYFLYPRRVLYLHQEEIPWYRDAEWLILDGPQAVSWIDPTTRPEYATGDLRLASFPMGPYLDLVASGEIADTWLPPSEPSRTPKSER